jgi:hypothetical protein
MPAASRKALLLLPKQRFHFERNGRATRLREETRFQLDERAERFRRFSREAAFFLIPVRTGTLVLEKGHFLEAAGSPLPAGNRINSIIINKIETGIPGGTNLASDTDQRLPEFNVLY